MRYMVEFNFENGKAMNIKFFDSETDAQAFALACGGVVYWLKEV